MAKKKTLQEFIADSNLAHLCKYTYKRVVYLTAFDKVIITCDKHGDFQQTPHDHTTKRKNGLPRGCPACANENRAKKTGNSKRRDLEYFIKSAQRNHNDRYDYSKSEYKGMLFDITIRCKVHGEFTQAAHSHIYGSGCPKCGLGNNSKIEKSWLDQCNIREKNRQHCINLNGKRIFVDGFDPSTNTVYEFYGDYWHGNPNKFNRLDKNTLSNKLFGELYDATINREELLIEAGYKIVSVWESEYKAMKGHSNN